MKQSANAYPLDNYSTTEQVVGEWIDGKPLYEITVHKNVNIAVANTWYAVGTLTQDASFTFITSWKIGTYSGNSYMYEMYVNDTTKDVNLSMKSYTGYFDSYITVRYTKTTD